jgi:hypothetical protein
MNNFYKIMMIDYCHEDLMDVLDYRFSIEERSPDNEQFNFIFSIFGS